MARTIQTAPSPQTVQELFANVRKNYFRLYFHYVYFNIFRSGFVQADAIFSSLILIPTIAAGKITLGILQQVATAFGQVSCRSSIWFPLGRRSWN